MPDTPAEPSGDQRAERITQLKPPGGLEFDSTDLSPMWKRWSEEIQLYMDLAIKGRDEKVKVKMERCYFTLLGARVEKYMKPFPLKRPEMIEHCTMLYEFFFLTNIAIRKKIQP